jgi:putative glycosyltransferase (TIGR04348 family)
LKISLVTPAGEKSRNGNRVTAIRWAKILINLGHRVSIAERDNGDNADMMIAVHAWRSHQSIKTFSNNHPNRPLIVLLAGTDIYAFQHSHPKETLNSMECATVLVGLHSLVHRAIPKQFYHKLHTIYQSALPLPSKRQPSKRTFDVCVIGHLRDEKDSLRASYAAQLASPDSKAHNEVWSQRVAKEMRVNPRFISLGEVPKWRVRRQFSTSHAMVISSAMEGGANVVSEANVCGLPIIASNIDGNVGLLGEDYEGYYTLKDTQGLAALLKQAENNPRFLKRLAAQGKKRQALFQPELEIAAWSKLINEITP